MANSWLSVLAVLIFYTVYVKRALAGMRKVCELEPRIDAYRKGVFQFEKPPVVPEPIKCTEELNTKAAELVKEFLNPLRSTGDAIEEISLKKPKNTMIAWHKHDLAPGDDVQGFEMKHFWYAEYAVESWENEWTGNSINYDAMMFARNNKFGIGVAKSTDSQRVYVLGLFEQPAGGKTLDQLTEEELFKRLLPSEASRVSANPDKDQIETLRKEFQQTRQNFGALLQGDQMLALIEMMSAKLELMTKTVKFESAVIVAQASNTNNAARNKLFSTAMNVCAATTPKEYLGITIESICVREAIKDKVTAAVQKLVACAAELIRPKGIVIDPKLLSHFIHPDDMDRLGESVYNSEKAQAISMGAVLSHDLCHFSEYEQLEYLANRYAHIDEATTNKLLSNDPNKKEEATKKKSEIRNDYMSDWKAIVATTMQVALKARAELEKAPKGSRIDRGIRIRLIEDRILDYCLLLDMHEYMKINEGGAVCQATQTDKIKKLKQCAFAIFRDWAIQPNDNRFDVEASDLKGYELEKLEKVSFARALAQAYCTAKGNVGPSEQMAERIIKSIVDPAPQSGETLIQLGFGGEVVKATAAETTAKTPPPLPTDAQLRAREQKAKALRPLVMGSMQALETPQGVPEEAVAKDVKATFAAANVIEKQLKQLKDEKVSQGSRAHHANKIVREAFRYCKTIGKYSYNSVTEESVCKEQTLNAEVIALINCASQVSRTYRFAFFNSQVNFARALVKYVCKDSMMQKILIKLWGLAHLTTKGMDRKFELFIKTLQDLAYYNVNVKAMVQQHLANARQV